MDDSYKEVSARELAEIKIKGSRFIGEVVPASSIEDAEAALGQIRKREYNATHHCWAYRLGVKGDLFRYSDDGEPSGTAGQPILRHIDGLGITNILVVVTRYYGGTKLGTGGLIRAYGEAARLVLEKSVIEEKILRDELNIHFAYGDTSAAMHTIGKYDVEIRSTEYSTDAMYHVAVRRSHVDAFVDAFVERLAGRGKIERVE